MVPNPNFVPTSRNSGRLFFQVGPKGGGFNRSARGRMARDAARRAIQRALNQGGVGKRRAGRGLF